MRWRLVATLTYETPFLPAAGRFLAADTHVIAVRNNGATEFSGGTTRWPSTDYRLGFDALSAGLCALGLYWFVARALAI